MKHELDPPQYAHCLPNHFPKNGMTMIDMTISICLNDSSHSSWINARSSSSSNEASEEGYESDDDDEAEEDVPGFEPSRGNGIGIVGESLAGSEGCLRIG
jgi:hypothetical protein